MLKRLSPRELLEQLSAEWEPTVRTAWIESVHGITSRIVLKRVVELLEKGDIAGAIREMGLEDAKFARLEIALRQAYDAGGIATVNAIPPIRDPDGNRIVFSWGVRNLAGEAELREHAANLVTGIVKEAIDGLREILTDSLARGQSPYKAALEAVGRVNRVTGKREGGLIGLSRPQMQTVSWIKQASLDGDREKLRQYLGLKRRDNRFDRTIIRALHEGRGLREEDASRVARQYSNRALKYRGDVIARHETMSALDRARYDGFRQQIEQGKLDAQDVTKAWHHQDQKHPRLDHVEMNGQVVAFDQPFTAADGTQLRFARDPNAPIRHTLNCKCRTEFSINYTAQALRRYRERTGG